MNLTDALPKEKNIVRNIAKQIIKKWGNKPHMIKKAREAALIAALGQPQDIFPKELNLLADDFEFLAFLLKTSQ